MSHLPDWLTAIGTIGATSLALGSMTLGRWWMKPRLALNIRFEQPDCQRMPFVTNYTRPAGNQFSNQSGSQDHNSTLTRPPSGAALHEASTLTAPTGDGYYFRLSIFNKGRSAAKQVEAQVYWLKSQRDDLLWERKKDFLATDLTWTHIDKPFLPLLPPGIKKNINLGTISRGDPIFQFALSILPNNGYDRIQPGKYRFRVVATASNCSPCSVIFSLNYSGNWHEEENDMFNEGIQINVHRKISSFSLLLERLFQINY